MTPKEIIQELYTNDGLRNQDFLTTVLHENFELTWHSSEGLLVKDKQAILDLASELKNNFAIFNAEVLYFIAENNFVSITFNQFGSSIENQKDLILLGRFMVVWEFEGDKIVKAYQISQPS